MKKIASLLLIFLLTLGLALPVSAAETSYPMVESGVKEIQKYAGRTIAELSKVYYLSEKRIQGIIHEYESSKRENDGKRR